MRTLSLIGVAMWLAAGLDLLAVPKTAELDFPYSDEFAKRLVPRHPLLLEGTLLEMYKANAVLLDRQSAPTLPELMARLKIDSEKVKELEAAVTLRAFHGRLRLSPGFDLLLGGISSFDKSIKIWDYAVMPHVEVDYAHLFFNEDRRAHYRILKGQLLNPKGNPVLP